MTAMPQELFSLEVADLDADSSNITALVRRAATGDMQDADGVIVARG